MLFGSDWPVITPDRWLADFAKLDIREEIRPKVLKANARKKSCVGSVHTAFEQSPADLAPGRAPSAMTIKAVVFDAYGTLYDIQSVAAVTEEAFPGYGEIITQIWRIKQLEYTWLRSLMRRYEDFSVVTRESLAYTLRILGLQYDDAVFERIMEKYLHLDLYPDAAAALAA